MSLRALSLAGRGLDTLPPALFEHADTLEQLDLSGNRLTTLPDTLARLTRLRVLFASNNPIERLPAVLGACPALEQIGLLKGRDTNLFVAVLFADFGKHLFRLLPAVNVFGKNVLRTLWNAVFHAGSPFVSVVSENA